MEGYGGMKSGMEGLRDAARLSASKSKQGGGKHLKAKAMHRKGAGRRCRKCGAEAGTCDHD